MDTDQEIIIRQQAEINRLEAMLRNMGVDPKSGNALPVTPTPVQPVQPVQPVVHPIPTVAKKPSPWQELVRGFKGE